ncbi:MAG: type II toxin-antitoxin system HicA family toxin [Candidatus Latescibacterota bacterium]
MSVSRRDLIRYLEDSGFHLLREGARHSIYTDGTRVVPVKRRRTLDRITANELCKQAGLEPRL